MICCQCGDPLDASTVFRCYDCEREFCKPCLIKHCDRSREKDELTREFDQAYRDAAQAINRMRAALRDRWPIEGAAMEALDLP